MTKSNRRTTVTKWAVNFRQRFCNALAVEHKYNNSLPINEAYNYKKKREQKLKVHTNTLRKSLSSQFSLKSFSLTNLSIGGGVANATQVCYSSTQFILQVFLQQRWPQSQLRPSATTRSSTVDFLHHQLAWYYCKVVRVP